MKRHIPYKEGTWFAIPLEKGGYAVGRVARHSPKKVGVVLAYFFGPKRESVPGLAEIEGLMPRSAITVLKIGDLGLLEGSWPIIGDSAAWKREDWPIPRFLRKSLLAQAKLAWLIEYSDDNPNQKVSEEIVPFDTVGFESDGLHGAGSAEYTVSALLG